MAPKKKIGDVLKDAGLIDDFQLESALSHQRNWGGKLGEILLEMGFIRREDIAQILSEHLRVPNVDLFDPEIPPAILKTLQAETAKKYTVMPVRKEGTAVLIAMADPLDITALDELRFIAGASLKPAFATAEDIKDAIRKYYDNEEVVRRPAAPAFEPIRKTGPMEIIGKYELPSGDAAPGGRQKPDTALRDELAAVRQQLEALAGLLVETGIISRNELLKRIEQKKKG